MESAAGMEGRTRIAPAEGALGREDRPCALAEEGARTRAILEERARVLSRRLPGTNGPNEAGTTTAPTLETVVFTLGGESFALESSHVREVVAFTLVTPLPGVSPHMPALANLRGEIVCVVDLRRLLNLPGTGFEKMTRLVVVGRSARAFALMVEDASEVRHIAESEMFAPGTRGAALHGLVRGVTRDATVVLDAHALLNDRRLFINAETE